MQKIRLNIKTISDSLEEKCYEGIINNAIISYVEDSKTKVEVDLNNRIIKREDFEKALVIDYHQNNIHLNLKEYNYELDMPIESIKEEYIDNNFSLKYKVEDKIVEYILEYEEIL